jgi:orotidine-5'-phosphate decarboxylase
MQAEAKHVPGAPRSGEETDAARALARGVVALDRPAWAEAERLVGALGDAAGFYKVGLELFTVCGPSAVTALRDRGKRVFLDLKLHDIPNTVAGAARAGARLGASLLTVHAGGGAAMVRAAVDAAAAANADTRVIAVTALTSLDPGALPAHFRADRPLAEIVLELTAEALSAGAAGVVLSGAEVLAVKARFGSRCLCVVPGVRAAGAAAHDQARVVTPARALEDGADYLVVGRAVTEAVDPLAAWRALWVGTGAAGGKGA